MGQQHAPQHLAHGRFWNLVDELVTPWPREFGQARSNAMGIEVASETSARSLMNAAMILPHCSSGRPTTTTSSTAGCRESMFSISAGLTFSPPVMIKSSTRPVTNRSPSRSK